MRGRESATTQKNRKLADEYKNSCPPQRHKDLEQLIKEHKGNKDKIAATIYQWWEEPQKEEEEWIVNKKPSKKQHRHNPNGGGSGNDRAGYYGRGGGRGAGYRSERDRGGRGGYGRGMNGGRGGGADRDRRRERGSAAGESGDLDRKLAQTAAVPQEKKESNLGPAPVKTETKLQGAWGQRAAAHVTPAAPAPLPATVEVDLMPVPVSAPVAIPAPVEPEPAFDVGVVTPQDPTPAGLVENTDVFQTNAPSPKAAVAPSNVWATKGSAHIIHAEKPKPKSPEPVSKPTKSREKTRQPNPQPIVEQILELAESTEPTIDSSSTLPEPVKEDPIVSPPPTTSSAPLDSGLPASVNGANINATKWKPMEGTTASSVDIVQPSPVGPVSVASTSVVDVPLLDITEPVQETIIQPEEPAPTLSVPASIESSLKPSSALNLGPWGETTDGEDNLSHEYGFGYVQDNDVVSLDEATNGSTTGANNVISVPQPTPAAPQPTVIETVPAPTTSTVSPARVPPGLGIGRPLPDQIIHVHELENKLESASLAAKKNEVTEKVDIVKATTKDAASSTTSNNTYTPGAQPVNSNEAFVQMPPAGIMSQNYNGQYGMNMYTYSGQNTAPNGFPMGVPNQAAPLLSNGVLPQQQKQQTVNAQQQGVGLPQQASLYGAPAPANNTTETTTNNDSSNTANPSANNAGAGMPPGIPNGIPYNPALFYGQQPYQMGQPHGVAGAYGFATAYGGQYGGVQGAFGYQQVMGQGGGYQPYDDQGHNGNHANHSNNSSHQGGYNKNSGGYRGRNNHSNTHHNQHNQYQNQYNPQGPGGYGNQPYTMAYNDFNQRGGYGPGAHMDSSYMQNSGGYQSGFNQDEGQQMSKGKSKGGNRNFGSNQNMNQYQQSQQQQFGGLQGAGSAGVSDTTGNNLNYQSWS